MKGVGSALPIYFDKAYDQVDDFAGPKWELMGQQQEPREGVEVLEMFENEQLDNRK